MLLNNEWVNNEIKREIKKFLETNEAHNNPKPTGHNEGSPETEGHSNTGLPKNHRNISNKQSNPASTRSGRTITNKTQSK